MSIVGDAKDLVEELGVGDLIKLGLSLTESGIDAGSKIYAKKMEERASLIKVAEVHSSDYRLSLEDAKRWLEEDGLKAEGVVVAPDIAYKDYSDMEVVATNFKLNQKVKPGTRIILKYVTKDVIEASRKMFDEAEKQRIATEKEKASLNAEKVRKKAEQDVKNKQKLDEAMANAKDGLGDVVSNVAAGAVKMANKTKGIGAGIGKFAKKIGDKTKSKIDEQGE